MTSIPDKLEESILLPDGTKLTYGALEAKLREIFEVVTEERRDGEIIRTYTVLKPHLRDPEHLLV